MKSIVGQCALYVAQMAHFMICTKSTGCEGAMYMFGWIIVGFLLLYYYTMCMY